MHFTADAGRWTTKTKHKSNKLFCLIIAFIWTSSHATTPTFSIGWYPLSFIQSGLYYRLMAQKGSIIIVILKVFFLSTLLLACARSHQEDILFNSPAPTTAKITSTAPEVTALPPPTSTSTRRPLLTNTLYPTNTKTNDVTEICSPLENISIPDLPDHVNNPFNPPRLSVDDHHMGVDFAVQEFGMALSGRPVHSVLQGTVVMILDDLNVQF